MKKYIKIYLRVIIEILVLTLVLTLFSYLNIINNTIYNYLELTTIILIIHFNSKKIINKKDEIIPLENLKFGVIIALFFLVLNIILGNSINIKTIIYFLIIIIVSILGNIRKCS